MSVLDRADTGEGEEEDGPPGAGAVTVAPLAGFLAALSATSDVATALAVAAEHAHAAFGGQCAIVRRGATSVVSAPHGTGDPAGVSTSVRLESPEGGELRVVGRRPFTRAETALLSSMAHVLVMAVRLLENREQERSLVASLQERQGLLERLARIQRSIFNRAPLQDVLDSICIGARDLLGDDVVGLRLLDPDDPTQLVLVSSVGAGTAIVDRPNWRTKTGAGIGGRAVAEGRLVVVEDYQAATCRLAAFAASGVQAAMAAPVFEAGRAVGSLTVATHTIGRRYSEAEREVLQTFAEHASLALNDARTAEALRRTLGEAVHQATHDPLTGLVNRTVVLERLGALLAGPDVAGVAVLFIDLDRFKLVNDSLGHDVGDRVLEETAARLARCVRPGDLVGRHAGDEFVVVCSGLHGEVDALGLADRICCEIAAPILLPAREIVITASVGIARGVRGRTADELLRDADVAMYQAKERGRDRTELFGRSMRARMMERVDVEHSLRRAVQREEFRLHYQPTVDLATGRPVLVEALLRWEHPERGLMSPEHFIPVAEDTRLIVGIGSWVLAQACDQVAAWRRSTPALADLEVSVNLSACQFGDDKLVELVAGALVESGLEPRALWLEITETAVMDDVAATVRTLGALKDLGVKIAIDDFGTGYSSLSYLKRFPVDVLKIDRSFVDGLGTDAEDTAIVTAVVRLAQALGKGVVAEGIEHDAQLVELRDLGCESGQGFLFSRPQPPEELHGWLVERLSG
ncbi:MAG TPA: bifunctional diguanylate cyclase/phosphodiesterase [Acidimicrobiales bacterium]|nr:bifunctional diguanylate cyclase/phosphodiesterase [Acidimicrobiales bacterium]